MTRRIQSKRKPRQRKAKEAESNITTYVINDIVHKPGTKKKFAILKNLKAFSGDTKFTLLDLQTKKVVEGIFTPKELWVLGYEVIGKEDNSVLQDLLHGRSRDTSDSPAHDTSNGGPREKCNGGKLFPLKECEIVEGEDPLKKGVKMSLKGNTVVGLKAKCPACGNIVRVKHSSRKNGFYLAKHVIRKA